MMCRKSCLLGKGKQACCRNAGIVQGMGTVTRVQQRTDFRSIDIQFPQGGMAGIRIGASVAINGTCLTACTGPSMHTLHDPLARHVQCS